MSVELNILIGAAAIIGFLHTILGPDHYLPFIVMSKARGWSLLKTSLITFLCGLGHVVSSVVLGFLGLRLGSSLFRLEAIESFRGELAAWLLISFGFAYFIWGLRRAWRARTHQHSHQHNEDESHNHEHSHFGRHTHVHSNSGANLTPWVLFTIFVLGPCEPLIPLLIYPAAKGGIMAAVVVASVFSLVTIVTMLSLVLVFSSCLVKFSLGRLNSYSHALAGLVIFLSGGAIKFLGL